MKKLTLAALVCTASLTAHAKTLTVGLDMSSSNPFLSDAHFVAGAAEALRAEISQLKEGDIVHIKTFGARGNAQNMLSRPITISRKNRSEKMADSVAQYIKNAAKKSNGQGETNLIGFLELTHGFDCRDNGKVIIITDGVESSEYLTHEEFIEGKKGLPEPEVDLRGCDLIFYGLGAGMKASTAKYIRKEWSAYADKAGAYFTPITP